MTKLIDKRFEDTHERNQRVYSGQIREDADGRVVMIIVDERFKPSYVNTRTVRTLILKESKNGVLNPYETVPRKYANDAEIIHAFPKVLHGTIVIHEEE